MCLNCAGGLLARASGVRLACWLVLYLSMFARVQSTAAVKEVGFIAKLGYLFRAAGNSPGQAVAGL